MSDDEREHLTLRFYRADLGLRVRRFERPASLAERGTYVSRRYSGGLRAGDAYRRPAR